MNILAHFPNRVYEQKLSIPLPPFDLCFPFQCSTPTCTPFSVYHGDSATRARISRTGTRPVLLFTTKQIGRISRIERPVTALQDVDEVIPLHATDQ